MVFNHVTEYIHRWTAKSWNQYKDEWSQEWKCTGRSLRTVKVNLVSDMMLEITSLVDREVESFEQYMELVQTMWDRLSANARARTMDPEELPLLDQVERDFSVFFEKVEPTVEAKATKYFRLIMGEERKKLLRDIQEKWGYAQTYWYPLCGGLDEDKLFLDVERVEPYEEQLLKLLGLPQERIYECSECDHNEYDCAEVDDLYGYGGSEVAYVPKDFSWIIYFSHENTVTFAGDILPMVKELLMAEREHWNKWD